MHIAPADVNAWLEETKLSLSALNAALEQAARDQVMGRLASVFDVSTWLDTATTPNMVKTIMSMYYASWIYDKAYADDSTDTSNYAYVLRRMADANINGLLSGDIILEEDPSAVDAHDVPSFFPNDASSDDRIGFHEDPSDGGPAFMLGTTF